MKRNELAKDDSEFAPNDQSSADGLKRTGRTRFGLLSLGLFIASVASWFAYWRQLQAIEAIEVTLAGLREIVRELIIIDPEQYAAVRMHELSMEDFRWTVHLPDGANYSMKVSYADIDESNFPAVGGSTTLLPGNHNIELRYRQQENSFITAIVDDKTLIELEPGGSWGPIGGSSGGPEFESSRQQPIDKPLVLFRRRFSQQTATGWTSPRGPTAGVLLYIERQ